MNSLFDNLTLLAGMPGSAPAAANADPTAQLLSTIVPFALIFVVFYFLIIRPQNKKQKEAKKMLSALKKGDKIQTIGGLRGTIWQTKEDTVIIKVEDDVKLEFVRSAVATVLEQKPVEEEKPAKEEKTSKDEKASKDEAVKE